MLICVGEIVAPHGVRGAVKLRSFTDDPLSILDYAPLTDENGKKEWEIKLLAEQPNGVLLVTLKGVGDRNMAESLRGTKIFAAKDSLPECEEEEYYHADLIGLQVIDAQEQSLGVVKAVHNFGGGDILEISLTGGLVKEQAKSQDCMVPFTKEVVPVVDLAKARIVAIIPPEFLPGAAGDKEEVEEDIEMVGDIANGSG
ncbi:MAG: ribosome maturation factor RimM [Alphaproteobacteria bacterium]